MNYREKKRRQNNRRMALLCVVFTITLTALGYATGGLFSAILGGVIGLMFTTRIIVEV